jgi:cyclophilin family peptidyl-prolyl cis-trans isomerase
LKKAQSCKPINLACNNTQRKISAFTDYSKFDINITMSKNTWIIYGVIMASVVAVIIFLLGKPTPAPVQSQTSITDTIQTPMPTSNVPSQPSQVIDSKKNNHVTLHTTAGDILIELDTTNTPITANNFAYLAKTGFYDNTIFHRTIKGFMIQGGDPNGTGTGGPGYKFADEYLQGKYTRGTVAMANSGPNTNGSQFFIMHQDYQLPNAYVIFGHVISGLDILDSIATAPVISNSMGESSKPVSPVSITTAEFVLK